MEIEKNLYKQLIETPPTSKEDAYDKWLMLSRAIQLLQIACEIPDGRVNQALRLSVKSK